MNNNEINRLIRKAATLQVAFDRLREAERALKLQMGVDVPNIVEPGRHDLVVRAERQIGDLTVTHAIEAMKNEASYADIDTGAK